MSIQQIVFDCDGILLESNNIKSIAFQRLGETFGKAEGEQLLDYHLKNGGVSRYEKFRWFYRNILKQPITDDIVENLGKKFSELVFEEIMRCPMVLGANEVLERYSGKLPMYVCSGTPHEELQIILDKRGLAKYFVGIYGTPPEKHLLLEQIVAGSNIAPEATLMVGDASTDREAAEYVGTLFYARGKTLAGGKYPYGDDLFGLLEYLNETKL